MESKTHTKAVAAAASANILVGLSFMFAKVALGSADAFILLSVRFAIAFALNNILIAVGYGKLDLKGKNLTKLIIMGIAQPFFYHFFEALGINRSSSVLAGIMNAIIPVCTTAVSALVLKESPTKKQAFFACFSLLFVILVTLGDGDAGNVTLPGFLLLSVCVASGSTFSTLSRVTSGDFSAFERTYMMVAIGFVGFMALALIKFGEGYPAAVAEAFKDPNFTFPLLYLSVVTTTFSLILFNYATTHLDLVKASSFSNLGTVVSVAVGAIFLREALSPLQIVFVALIMAGVYGVNISGKKPAEAETPKPQGP